jgi:hypothetical protein
MKKILITLISTIGIAGLLFAGAANKNCPTSGKAINADKTANIGVCCKNCAGKATKALEAGGKKAKAFLKKVTADNKDGDTVNKNCPISGKAAKTTVTVGFCCGNCLGKFTGKK